MVSESELLINLVIAEQAKVADSLEPKGEQVVTGLFGSSKAVYIPVGE